MKEKKTETIYVGDPPEKISSATAMSGIYTLHADGVEWHKSNPGYTVLTIYSLEDATDIVEIVTRNGYVATVSPMLKDGDFNIIDNYRVVISEEKVSGWKD